MKQILCTFSSVILLTVMLVTGTAEAQEPIDVQKAQITKLSQFLGEWKSVEAGYEGTDGNMEFEMTMEVVKIVQGFAVEMSVSAEIAEVGSYAEKDFLAFDPFEEKVTMLTVSNFGEVAKYSGNWDSDNENVLRLSGTRAAKGKEFVSEITITFTDDETFTWNVDTFSGGEKTGTFRAKFIQD